MGRRARNRRIRDASLPPQVQSKLVEPVTRIARKPTARRVDAGTPGGPGGRLLDSGTGARPTRPSRIPPDAAPYDQSIADRVPPYGQRGRKTSGVAVMDDGRTVPLDSGDTTGRARELPKPRRGMNGNNVSHVEAHTAAEMRLGNHQEATLYINRLPCPGRTGCDQLLPRMVPPRR